MYEKVSKSVSETIKNNFFPLSSVVTIALQAQPLLVLKWQSQKAN
jgi:hypothetical protein